MQDPGSACSGTGSCETDSNSCFTTLYILTIRKRHRELTRPCPNKYLGREEVKSWSRWLEITGREKPNMIIEKKRVQDSALGC